MTRAMELDMGEYEEKHRIDRILAVNFVQDALEVAADQLDPVANRLFSRHNADLLAVAVVYILLIIVVLGLVSVALLQPPVLSQAVNSQPSSANVATSLLPIFGTAVFGALVGLLSRLIEAGQKRLSTVELFASEILNVGRIFVAVDIGPSFIRAYAADDPSPQDFADVALAETYLSVFDKPKGDLDALASASVRNITAFYGLFKSLREAVRSLAVCKGSSPYTVAQKQRDVFNVIYLCLLCTIHGRLSLETLIPERGRPGSTRYNDRNRTYIYMRSVFHTIEAQCFLFLYTFLPNTDHRSKPVAQRAQVYIDLLRLYVYDPTEFGLPKPSA